MSEHEVPSLPAQRRRARKRRKKQRAGAGQTSANGQRLRKMWRRPWGVQGDGKPCEQTAPDAPKAVDVAPATGRQRGEIEKKLKLA